MTRRQIVDVEQVGWIGENGELRTLGELTIRDITESPLRTANPYWTPIYTVEEAV